VQHALRFQFHERCILAQVVCARFDLETTTRFKEEASEAMARVASIPFVLDMSQVEFIPSLTLGALVELRNRLERDGRRLVLIGLRREVRHILEVTSLTNLFEIRDTAEQAVE
jgi:anti-anti-sigma factor